jgi:hypothetical protein
MIQTLLVLLAIVMAVMLIRRRMDVDDPEAQMLEVENLWDHAQHPYHCVVFKCPLGNCPGIAPLKGRLYLVGDGHELPVPECTSTRCRCRYVHYPDRRRREEDRRSSFGLEQEMYRYSHERDRRLAPGRRKGDWLVDMELPVG